MLLILSAECKSRLRHCLDTGLTRISQFEAPANVENVLRLDISMPTAVELISSRYTVWLFLCRDSHISHARVFLVVDLLDRSQRFGDIKERRPKLLNLHGCDGGVFLLESAVQILSASLKYKVVVRASFARFRILFAVFVPSEILDNTFLPPDEVEYSTLPIKIFVVVICELLDDQLVILQNNALV